MRTVLTLLAAYISLNSFCQKVDYQTLTIENKTIELHQQKTDDKDQYLIVKDQKNNRYKKIELEKEYSPYYFGPHYTGIRNFIIIEGLHKFYILNIHNNILIGPLRAEPRGEAQDAQSGVMGGYKIIDNGQYLLVNAMDFGVFCYDLHDLYFPKKVQYFKSDSIFFKGKYIFLSQIKKNIYNMISASGGNYAKNIEFEFLFKGYRLQQDKNLNAVYHKVSDKYLVFNQIKGDSSYFKLIVDLKTGTLTNNKMNRDLDAGISKE